MKAVKGHIVYTKSPEKFEIFENSWMVQENGVVTGIFNELPAKYDGIEKEDFGDCMIIPGFVDLHFHAPQFQNIGLGLDKELLPWLEDYTFPEESKYQNEAYAKRLYASVAKAIWKNGTTRVVLFSTLHKNGTKILMDTFHQAGLGAFVGKVNMDRNTPDILSETTEDSIRVTEELLIEYGDKYDLVKPIITPRFVPTCTPELMKKLAELAKQYKAPIQSHISENTGEVIWVSELHPECASYADVYDKMGLLTDRTIMAHCVHNTDEEIQLMADRGVFAAHCPNANYNLSSGIMPVRKFMNMGVNVGLGTDVGAGHKVSIANVMSQAVQGSKMKWLETDKALDSLTTSEAFYLGTKGGGAYFGKVGSFEDGYEMDALVINDDSLGEKEGRSIEERLQRYIYCGDDRNIIKRFVKGRYVAEPKF